jgi:cold shock CspA family protein
MPLTGKLRSWNDDRGYGFIAPTHGGRELFVHISAFPSDGSRPTVGETLTYELGKGDDGKPQAVKVYRQALGRPSDYPRSLRGRTARKPSRVFPVVGVVLSGGRGRVRLPRLPGARARLATFANRR